MSEIPSETHLVNIENEMCVAFTNFNSYSEEDKAILVSILLNNKIPIGSFTIMTRKAIFLALIQFNKTNPSNLLLKLIENLSFGPALIDSILAEINDDIGDCIYEAFKNKNIRYSVASRLSKLSKKLTNKVLDDLLTEAIGTHYFGEVFYFASQNNLVDKRKILATVSKNCPKKIHLVLSKFPEMKRYHSMI